MLEVPGAGPVKFKEKPNGPASEIIRRIEEKGMITFSEFMDLALYWPEGGYYVSSPDIWGKGGDYITNVDVSPAFQKMLAKEVHEMWNSMGSPDGFCLVEAGAGRGWLSKGILKSLELFYQDLFGVINLILIEKNPNLREPSSEKIIWYDDISRMTSPVPGCILSNELIDSFPVHRVIYENGLKELYTGFDGSLFFDIQGPPSTDGIRRYFEEAGIDLQEGQTAEVNLLAGEWIKAAGQILESGFVITIDYGLPVKELYAPWRKGTLLCHSRHTSNKNPYKNIGSQDITTHVDFTTLVKAGESTGLKLAGFTTQKNFLLGLGILDELIELESLDLENYAKIKHNQSIKKLIMPNGMGDDFKVLIQHKGIEKPALMGFSFKEMSSYL